MSAPTSESESSRVSRNENPCLRRQSHDAEPAPGALAPDDEPRGPRAGAEGTALGPAVTTGPSPSPPPSSSMTPGMATVVDHARNQAPRTGSAWDDPSMALSTPSRPIVGR